MKIILDSTCDLPDAYLEEHNIDVVPVYINIDNKDYLDKYEITYEDFYQYLRENKENLPKTSGTSPKEFFDRISKNIKNHSSILISTLTSKLSVTYQSAKIALKRFKGKKIFLIDSKSGSGGLGLLALNASKMIKKGFSDEEVVTNLEEMVDQIIVVGYVDNLYNLKQSGRVSASKYWFASMMKFKPILQVQDGLILPLSKATGKEKGIKKLIKNTVKKMKKNQQYDIMITHADDEETAKHVLEALERKFTFGEKIINFLTPALSLHLGLGGIIVSLVPSFQ